MLLRLNGLSIGLDSAGGDVSFVSHAHADHLSPLKHSLPVIASHETFALARTRVSVRATPILPSYGELHDAGHMLGARQLLVKDETHGRRVVYTGDFKVEEDVFGFRATQLKADVLIMDCTYCHPSHSFSHKAEVYESLLEWVRGNETQGWNSVIGAYPLGKAQEIVRVLNRDGIVPIVTDDIARGCDIYTSCGFSLSYLSPSTAEELHAFSKSFVAVVPHQKATRYLATLLTRCYHRKTLCAVATGWNMEFDVDHRFPLSDHCDFEELLTYAERSGADTIYASHGDARALADYGFTVRDKKNGDEIALS